MQSVRIMNGNRIWRGRTWLYGEGRKDRGCMLIKVRNYEMEPFQMSQNSTFSVYASYPDVTAEDFLFVQTDTTYRKVWDKSAITLEVVDNDPVNKENSQIIYWEMLWPVSNYEYIQNSASLLTEKASKNTNPENQSPLEKYQEFYIFIAETIRKSRLCI